MSLDHLFPVGRVAAIAHRGGARLRPENTLVAFDHAVSLGVDAIECDVHLSGDGVPVVIHDSTLDRTTDQSGAVEARTAVELAALDAAARFDEAAGFPHRGLGIGVPRLADAVDRHPSTPFIVEIKGDRPDVVPPVIEVMRRSRQPARFVIGGFSQAVVDAVRRMAPEIPTSASRSEVQRAIRRSYIRLPPRRTGFHVFQVPFRFQGAQVFHAAFVRTAVRAGVPVQAWIIDAPEDMRRLIDWGIAGLISDRPDVALRVTREHRR